ncbi:MAG: endonuclease-8, partial [Myxococcota bacterium]
GDLGVMLATADDVLVCFFAKEVERIREAALPTHPVLGALGPDLLQPPVPLEVILDRALSDPERPLREVLLDQRVATGIGNEWCCELCFLHERLPETPVAAVGREALGAVYSDAAERMAASVGVGLRNTTGRKNPRTFVYGRRGRACLRCGHRVTAANLGPWHRITYWCPGCQR